MASTLSKGARARRYLQASMEAGYTGLPAEHREAKEGLMRSYERAYAGVRRHALAGSRRHFDKPLEAGERAHQAHLREQEGLGEGQVQEIQRELDQGEPRSATRRTSARRSGVTGPARAAAGAAGGAIAEATGGGGNTLLYFVGGALLLALAYLLLKGGESGGGKLITGVTGLVTGGVRAFVAPVDPIAAAERALGAGPISAPSSSSAAASTPSPPAKTNSAGYTKPFAGATPGRIDEGQDFSLTPGAAIRAIGPGKVTGIFSNWYSGQPLVAYELTGGPQKGQSVYVAEQITPRVKVGQKLHAGQLIGTYAASGTGIETGWATGIKPGGVLPQAGPGATAAGKSFSSFLSSLGVATG